MILRGAIYEVRALPGARGREQQGRRYAVIIQSDRFSTSTVTVAMTSTRAGAAVYRPVIEFDGARTRVLTDQIYSLHPTRLGEFRGVLAGAEARELDRALMLKLGLV